MTTLIKIQNDEGVYTKKELFDGLNKWPIGNKNFKPIQIEKAYNFMIKHNLIQKPPEFYI